MRTHTKINWPLLLLGIAAGLALGNTVARGEQAVQATIEIANTADPALLGATVYEFSAAVFMRNTTSISIRSFYPFLVVTAGQARQLGPFELLETPTAVVLLGRKGPPGPTMDSLAVTISPLGPVTVHEEGTLRITVRLGDEHREEGVVLAGYLLAVRQFWCSRSEGPLYLLQTSEFGVGLDGFYVLVGEPRWPWLDDPVLQPLVGKNVQVRGRLIPAGEDVPLSEGRSATYPLPAIVVEEIGEVELFERCGF